MHDEHDRHVALDLSLLAAHIAAATFAVFFAVLVIWLVASKPNAKLFEADNTVCFSQPLDMQCQRR